MSNTLIPADVSAVLGTLAPSKYGSSDDFKELASSVSFLPRIQLMGANSGLVQQSKINQGHYAIIHAKDRFDDLTKEVPCLPLAWRSKALQIDGDEITTIYDRKNPLFEQIAKKSEESDSGAMFGPEFLLWIPSVNAFGTFYMSSKTARREAPRLRDQIGKPTTLRSQLIKGKKYSWFGPVVTTCSQGFNLPTTDKIVEQVNMFNNPPESEKEIAPEGSDTRER